MLSFVKLILLVMIVNKKRKKTKLNKLKTNYLNLKVITKLINNSKEVEEKNLLNLYLLQLTKIINRR